MQKNQIYYRRLHFADGEVIKNSLVYEELVPLDVSADISRQVLRFIEYFQMTGFSQMTYANGAPELFTDFVEGCGDPASPTSIYLPVSPGTPKVYV